MKNLKFYLVLSIGIAIGVLIMCMSVPVYAYMFNSQRVQDCYLNIKTDFNTKAVGDGVNDDTTAFQEAFAICASTHQGLYIPAGTYLVSNLSMNDLFNIKGDGCNNTFLKSNGTSGASIYIRGKLRVKISDFTIISAGEGEALDYGIKVDSALRSNYPGMMNFENIKVMGLQKENATAFYTDDCSHLGFDNCSFSTNNGTAFKIEGTNYNTGVFNFKSCRFGNPETDKYGMEVKNGPAIDSISFESCYFGGKISAEKIGSGNNMVRTIVHSACRYENFSKDDTQLIELLGGSGFGSLGISWYDCTLVGNGVCNNCFTFRKGRYSGISIIGCKFDNISPGGCIINNIVDGAYSNCEFKMGTYIGTYIETTPKLFSNDAVFRDDGGWLGGWSVIDEYYDFQKGLKIGGARITTSKSKPAYGHFEPGDIVYNSDIPVVKISNNKKYFVKGWKRVTSGNSNVLNVDWLEMRSYIGS